jgi:hypothetical protein
MRKVLLVSAGLMLGGAAANAGPCPASVTDDVQPPAGGSAQVEHKFRYVSFYAGDPKDQVNLAPDDGPDPSKLEQRWELTRKPGEKITMVCRYHDTDKTFVDTLPASIKSCTLTGQMDGQGRVIGSPTLECK